MGGSGRALVRTEARAAKRGMMKKPGGGGVLLCYYCMAFRRVGITEVLIPRCFSCRHFPGICEH